MFSLSLTQAEQYIKSVLHNHRRKRTLSTASLQNVVEEVGRFGRRTYSTSEGRRSRLVSEAPSDTIPESGEDRDGEHTIS